MKLVEKASQFLASQLPPHYNPRDARHINNSPVMKYHTEVKDYDCNALREHERDAAKTRADFIGGEVESTSSPLELKGERTGVIHLVHCWYPQGHDVSKPESLFILLTDYPPGKDGPLF